MTEGGVLNYRVYYTAVFPRGAAPGAGWDGVKIYGKEECSIKEKTNRGLVEWANRAVQEGWVYWYGTVGYRCTRDLYERKKKQYPDHYTAERTQRYMKDIEQGRICADCINLIKAYMWQNEETGKQEYASNGCPDTNANGMFARAQVKGAIDSMPDVPGLIVRFDRHAGVYVGGGEVIEARGFSRGVVRTKLTDRPWTHWYRMPGLNYDLTAETENEPAGEQARQTLETGCSGAEVEALQKALEGLGFDCGGADGKFGERTKQALIQFQVSAGVQQDGVYGPETRMALTNALEKREEEAKSAGSVEITGGTVYVRAGAGTEYEKIGVVRKGMRLRRIDLTGWVPVLYNGEVRFISEKYVV